MKVVAQRTYLVLKIFFLSVLYNLLYVLIFPPFLGIKIWCHLPPHDNCFDQPTAWPIGATCVLRLVIGSDYSFFLYHFLYFTEDILVGVFCLLVFFRKSVNEKTIFWKHRSWKSKCDVNQIFQSDVKLFHQ